MARTNRIFRRMCAVWSEPDDRRVISEIVHVPMCGRLRIGRDFLYAEGLVGAAMCSAFKRFT
jgi:hypothetical protein